ncbi:MAG: NADH-quinone oxidoreductase subunit J [Acidobacteria bacterium]|nr:NADH-quinone oxidoreductase subunit J [Acidobacteriota bacterium]
MNVLPGFFFYLLSAIILGGAILTITRRNAVHSAIWLIVTLLGVAGIYLNQHAEFLAAVQVLVYIGGIMVLFLFVIMLVNLDEAAKQRQFNHQWTIAVGCALALMAELAYFIVKGRESFRFGDTGTGTLNPDAAVIEFLKSCRDIPGLGPGGFLQPNTELIACALYRDYLLPFEIASVLLLVAIVGAVVMAKKEI